MKTIAAIPLLVAAFAACSTHKSAEYPDENVDSAEPSSVDPASPSHVNDVDRDPTAADAVAPSQASTNADADPAANSSVALVPAAGQPERRQPAERTIQPPSTADRPASTWSADKPSTDNPAGKTAVDADKTTPGADNTGINERDRKGTTKTPLDQGNGEVDLGITQAIRKAVVADNSLSFTAKNVKIITAGGHVTLRGPVKTADERAKITAFAKQAAGVLSVDDQIEIAP